eukprot:Pgem_evm1s12284
MTPMATIIPTVELLVPGSTMVKMLLSLSSGGNSNSYAAAFTFTSISIGIGFLVGDAVMKSVFPCIGRVLDTPRYSGSFNNFNPNDICDDLDGLNPVIKSDTSVIMQSKIIPDQVTAYIVLVVHK